MREELASLGAPLLGVVANGFKARDTPGYDYYYAPAAGYVQNGEVPEAEPAVTKTPG